MIDSKKTLLEIQANVELSTYLKNVHDAILRILSNTVPEVENYVASTSGKRIRSTLFFLAVKALDKTCEVPVEVGAAFEILHTATLMHDDVIDNSLIRRGKASFKALHGDNFSLLAGDLLVCVALELIWETKIWRLVKLYSELGQNLVKGEVSGAKLTLTSTPAKYYTQVHLKTGCFFETICKAASSITQCDKVPSNTIISFGKIFGRVFQIVDDYTDYFLHRSLLDKPQGGDFLNGVITLPIIYAYKKADALQRQFISNSMVQPNMDKLRIVLKMMRSLSIDKMLFSEVSVLAQQCEEKLNILENSIYRRMINEVLNAYIARIKHDAELAQ